VAVVVGGVGNHTCAGTWDPATYAFTAAPTCRIPGAFSFIGNGFQNQAAGNFSTTVNGCFNIVCASNSAVITGCCNTVTQQVSFIGTGLGNTISGEQSFVATGGITNVSGTYSAAVSVRIGTLSGNYSFIGSGLCNVLSSCQSVIGSGALNLISSDYSFIGTGFCSVICNSGGGSCALGSVVVGGIGQNTCGGCFLTATCVWCANPLTQNAGQFSFIGGGFQQRAGGNFSFIGGGRLNNASAAYATVVGGNGNEAQGACSFIGAGLLNFACGAFSTISGGCASVNCGVSGTIGGGSINTNYGLFGTISGGSININCSCSGTIGGGECNCVTAAFGTIVGGHRSCAWRYGQRSFALGANAGSDMTQQIDLLARNTTNDNSCVLLYLDGSATKIAVACNTSMLVTVLTMGIRDNGDSAASAMDYVLIKNDAGTTTMVHCANIKQHYDCVGYSIAITGNDTDDTMDITVNGDAGETLRWISHISGVETKFADV